MAKHARRQTNIPEQPVIVVGSYRWTNFEAVREALNEVAADHENLVIITSGCPQGAELFARGLASMNGWHVANMRDEELPTVPNAIALGFVRDESPGATAALNNLRPVFWTRTFTDTASTPEPGAWQSR